MGKVVILFSYGMVIEGSHGFSTKLTPKDHEMSFNWFKNHAPKG